MVGAALTSRRLRRARRALATMILLALAAAACGGSDNGSAGPEDEDTTARAATPSAGAASPSPEGVRAARPLAVSDDQRFLQHADGTPFFYLGDTAWELFHRLDRDEAELYLEDRRRKGFTVVQAVALAEQGGLSVENAYGHLPLVDRDPARPDVRPGRSDDYWDHVDHVVQSAGKKGMHVGFLPTWGDKVEKLWGRDGEPIFTTDNARAYGRFLGERYRDHDNIIWILGGDRGPNEHDIEVWREMARGLEAGDGGRHLKTYHPSGGRTSSTLLRSDPLFDFDMVHSGHCGSLESAADMVTAAYAEVPVRPVLDAEPRYEDHPKCFEPEQGWWDGHDARRIAYLQTFSGAFGHTYGDHNVWQFHSADRSGVSWARTPWRRALDHPGAAQVRHVRRLLESRPFFSRVPDQGIVTVPAGGGDGLVRATRSSDGSYAAVYSARGQSFSVDLTALSGEEVRAWWFDPRTGTPSEPWLLRRTGGSAAFDPPGDPGRENDWVLVLDDAARGFSPPGATSADR